MRGNYSQIRKPLVVRNERRELVIAQAFMARKVIAQAERALKDTRLAILIEIKLPHQKPSPAKRETHKTPNANPIADEISRSISITDPATSRQETAKQSPNQA